MKISNGVSAQKQMSSPLEETNVKIQGTEEYGRCGQEINCQGACCGEPRCVDCFGEFKGEVE